MSTSFAVYGFRTGVGEIFKDTSIETKQEIEKKIEELFKTCSTSFKENLKYKEVSLREMNVYKDQILKDLDSLWEQRKTMFLNE